MAEFENKTKQMEEHCNFLRKKRKRGGPEEKKLDSTGILC
jgi:hypothetical protein